MADKPMHPHLQQAAALLSHTAGALTPVELARHPDGKWSAAEILEHLGLTFSRTADGMQRVLDTGAPAALRADGAQWVRTFIVVQCGYFPAGRRSPKEVLPAGCDPAEVLAGALANLTRMDGVLDAVAAAAGARAKVLKHPVIGPLSVDQWRKFHWIHTRHHARQIAERAHA